MVSIKDLLQRLVEALFREEALLYRETLFRKEALLYRKALLHKEVLFHRNVIRKIVKEA